MARADELRDDRGADEARCAGDEYGMREPPGDRLSSALGLRYKRSMSVAAISIVHPIVFDSTHDLSRTTVDLVAEDL